jgi:hypothetical protein
LNPSAGDIAPRLGWAARALVLALQACADDTQRASLLQKLARTLGDCGYPLFIKLLAIIGEGAPPHEQTMVARALLHGLQSGNAATGTLSRWGLAMPVLPKAQGVGDGFLRMAAARPLEPLAYLAVWSSQPTGRPVLPWPVCEDLQHGLLALLCADAGVGQAYRIKLANDIAAAVDGSFNAVTLQRLHAWMDAWCAQAAGGKPLRVAHAHAN